MGDLKKLKLAAKGFKVLYVEDNKALRENAAKLLNKFFDHVDTAEDGKIGFDLYKKHQYQIVLTDIKMPNMDGMELAQHIKDMDFDTKVIVMSAFDDREFLYSSIELGVFRYLKKPVNINEFTDVLDSCVTEIKKEQDAQIFTTNLHSIFNYQSSMIMMLNGTEPVVTNQILLDFFGVQDLSEFVKKYNDLGSCLLEHDGFLYNTNEKNWFDILRVNEQKLYHVKIKSKDDEFKHFMLKFQNIPDKEGYGVLSLDDITELNLLKLFDESQSNSDDAQQDTQALFRLLEVIKNNAGKVQLHNYYKGLSIMHDAVIVDLKKDTVVVKTNFLQEKAVQFEKKTIMTSEALPYEVACSEVVKIGFESQKIEFKKVHFVTTSPVQRQTVRIVPEESTKVSLFLGENRYQGETSIEDVSLDSVKLKIESLPPGLNEGEEVIIDMVFDVDKTPSILNTQAVMFRKQENKNSFSIVFMFKFAPGQKSILVKYITKRQMNIIKEFKGMQNG